MKLPKVSVLVAAWNEESNIENLIRGFAALRYPNKELVVCAGGDDRTSNIARGLRDRNVCVLDQRYGEGKQRALRRALNSSSGEIIFLTDADCILDNDMFEQTLSPLFRSEMVATGSYRPLDEELSHPFALYQWYCHLYGAAKHRAYVRGLEGRNTALWREVLTNTGALEASVPIGTDYFLAQCILAHGYRIRYVPHSQVKTKQATGIMLYLQQQSRWQRNIILHGLKFSDWRAVFLQIRRGMLSVFILSTPLFGILLNPLLVLPWAVLFLHVVLVRARSMHWGRLSTGHARTPNWRHLVLYSTAEFAANAIAWKDLVRSSTRWKW